jgi:P27 family predicted phage terminase small subunit
MQPVQSTTQLGVGGGCIFGDSPSRPDAKQTCIYEPPVQIRLGTTLKQVKPPKHLRADTAAWFAQVIADFELDSHHVRLLQKACEAWDRSETAREAIAEHGLTYLDRFQNPKARPECAIERDSRLAFCRIVREIGLDVSPPNESRPTPLRANR